MNQLDIDYGPWLMVPEYKSGDFDSITITYYTGVEQPKFDFQVHYWLSTFFAPSSTFLGENKYI